ncbi:MAG: transcriptional regulator [Armatimonadetes bacterium]|nr:transcriptional regulator [Armatimonadota bacterium]
MEEAELQALLTDLESDRVERKESLSDPNRIREAVCAFANDLPGHGKPGVVFVGARDDGSCAGLSVTDRLLLDLAAMRDDGNILPLPSLMVQKRTIAGCELAVVIVQPAEAPPVRYRGRTWIRVGPRRAIATPEEERRLLERWESRRLPFDLQPVPGTSLDDLDLEWLRREYVPACVSMEVLEANDRSLHQQLASVRFLSAADESARPTVVGVLVGGKDPQRFLPGAYIQFVRFAGTELVHPVKHQKELTGPLPLQLRLLDELLDAHVSVSSAGALATVEKRHPDFPPGALRQLARNAVIHRTYDGTNAPTRIYWFDDRVEIHSPGGPYGQVTADNFGAPGVVDYRNPDLAEAARNLGYVQRFGVGIRIARQELEANGNPPLEFVCDPSYVLATVRCRP